LKRIVQIQDLHIPYHVHLRQVLNFIYDFKPHKIILNGDIHDFTAASHWIANQSLHLDHGTIMDNYRELQEILLEPLRMVAPYAEIIYCQGNHEDWLNQTAAINPNGRGYWEMDRNIDLKRYNMTLVPLNTPYQAAPHLFFLHGIYTNKYHARQTVEVYQTNIFYGHTHDRQVYTVVAPINKLPQKGASCGCLTTRKPKWLRNRPNRWVHGLSYYYVNEESGYFNDYFVHIIDGKFMVNGLEYK